MIMSTVRCGYFTAASGVVLYGVYHHPAAAVERNEVGEALSAGAQKPAVRKSPPRPVVILPPLFEERKSAYAALRGLAEALATAGRPVLRFDWRGEGESAGQTAGRSFVALAEDAEAARRTLLRLSLETVAAQASGQARRESSPAEELFSEKTPVVWVGVRLGGTAALYWATERLREVTAGVVAVAPVVSGAKFLRHLRLRAKLRAELTTRVLEKSPENNVTTARTGKKANDDEVLDFAGYDVSRRFPEELRALDLEKSPPALAVPARLLQISPRRAPGAELQRARAALLKARTDQKAAVETTALVAPPFWERLEASEAGKCPPLNTAVLQTLDEFECGAET